MPTFFPAKMQKNQLAGLIALLGMAAIFINTAIAITAFVPQNQPAGYVAQDEMSSYNLTSGNETLYRPEYERDKWSGNLYAYPVDAAGNLDLIGERWVGGASANIDQQDYDMGRKIATMKIDGTRVPFRASSFTTGGIQETSLQTTVLGTLYTSEQIVNFLRGDRSNENTDTKLRARHSVLGDIMHTRPYYVADDASPTIFVGANDGMLHAINTNDGTERWAYVPSMLISKMRALAANPYEHDYYVDGQIGVGKILISSISATVRQRVLAGGLGGGGRGLYALNINSLTAATEQEVADKILWEITPNSVSYALPTVQNAYTNLGYTYGVPKIAKVHGGSGADIDAVIVGNGYNNGGSSSCNPSSATTGAGATLATTGSDCQAYLYVINAVTGQRIMAIKAGASGTAASPNGLSTPAALDINADDVIDRAYAGDLNGTMWKFDLSDPEPRNWSATVLHTTNPAQPITGRPGVATHPGGGYMVNFGTGATFTGIYGTYNHSSSTWTTPSSGDLGNTAVHYVYGIWDNPLVAAGSLVPQTLEERSYTHTDSAGSTTTTLVRRSTANAPNWATDKGWRVALPAGERIAGDGSFTENARFYFNSYNPTVAPFRVPDTDTDIYGENWLMELNYLTGGSSTEPFLDMDGNLLLNSSDRIKYIAGDTSIPAACDVTVPAIAASATCAILTPSEKGIPVGKLISTGVQSQPILVQLQTLNTTLFNQNPDVIFPVLPTAERGVRGGHFDADIFFGANNHCSRTPAVGYIDFTYGGDKNLSDFSIKVAGVEILTDDNPPERTRSQLAAWVVGHHISTDYTLSASGNRITITARNLGATYNRTLTVSANHLDAGDRTITDVTGGVDGNPPIELSDVSTLCTPDTHSHQYDDIYDKTGLDMLNPSYPNFRLSRAIPDPATPFKVLMMNQYLSPAARFHINTPGYLPTSANGYISVKDYQTAATLNIAAVPTHTRATLQSLAINLPTEGFVARDWWEGAAPDERAGLHPTNFGCVIRDSGVGADMYNPVIPPANGTNGPGVGGPGAVTGARHNGALTVQIIKDATPQDAIEQNVDGRPEYGYRVKHTEFYRWVLAEYSLYWHHPNRMCYHTPTNQPWSLTNPDGNAWNTTALMTGHGFSKRPPEDTAPSSAASPPAAGSTDPKLGMTSATTHPATNVTRTVITYVDGSIETVVRTENSDGTVTIVSTLRDALGHETITTRTIASGAGSVKTGGDERGLQSRTGRISWHELIRN